MIFLWFSHFPMIFPWFSHPFDFGDAARSAEASAACPSRRVCPSRRRASTATTRTWPGTRTCWRRLAWWNQCIYIHRYDIYILYIYKCVYIYICFFPSRSQKRSTLRRSCLNSTAIWYLAVMADPPVKGYIAHGFASANEIHWWICWWTKITAIHAS